jgi:hypothetical protein
MLSQPDGWTVLEMDRQCVVRTANEALELANECLPPLTARGLLQCECDDPACRVRIVATHAEYEAVRASGSQFMVAVDHENPENACVVGETARYSIVDVVVGAARYAARAKNPRHAWIERRAVRPDAESGEGVP